MGGLQAPSSPPSAPPPPGALALLCLPALLCGLVPGGAAKESKGIFPESRRVHGWNVSPKSVSLDEDAGSHRLKASRNPVWTRRRRRGTLNWPKRLLGGFGPLAGQPKATATTTPPTWGPGVTAAASPEARPGCLCPEGAAGAHPRPQGRGPRRRPTPRTEEAAWAASALTFLLVALTLAVLYTRLHRKCRPGRSLYWAPGGEEDRETVAAVIKRRLLSSQVRRKKRPRPKQEPPAASSTSSDSSD